MGYTFNGGIHPYDGKDLSKDTPIKNYRPEGEMVFPLSQHIGAPAKALVKKGDQVYVGQLIAEAGGFVSANIYSSVSGKVKTIEPRRLGVGSMCESIVIDNDGFFTTIQEKIQQAENAPEAISEEEKAAVFEARYMASPDKPWKEMSKEEIINRIKEAGIVGMGGAGFPNHVKLSPKEPDKIEYIIVNGAECEPYLTSDYRVMLEHTDELIEGAKIILSLFDNARVLISIEDNKPDCISLIRDKVRDEDRIEVRALKTKYPQGSERQLIYAVTKRAINSTMLPADAGCIVDNIDTVYAIYDAVVNGNPLINRIVTVTGDAVRNPMNFRVPVGTCSRELIEAAGGFEKTPEKIISGGPMMGFAMFDLDTPITKTSSSLLCLTNDEVSKAEQTACINCGRCVSVCPSRLVPGRLAEFSLHDDRENFNKYYGTECMECGSCSYVCPAKRQLAQAIKTMRAVELMRRREEKK